MLLVIIALSFTYNASIQKNLICIMYKHHKYTFGKLLNQYSFVVHFCHEIKNFVHNFIEFRPQININAARFVNLIA